MATSKNHTGIFKKLLVGFIGQEEQLIIDGVLMFHVREALEIEVQADTKVAVPRHPT